MLHNKQTSPQDVSEILLAFAEAYIFPPLLRRREIQFDLAEEKQRSIDLRHSFCTNTQIDKLGGGFGARIALKSSRMIHPASSQLIPTIFH